MPPGKENIIVETEILLQPKLINYCHDELYSISKQNKQFFLQEDVIIVYPNQSKCSMSCQCYQIGGPFIAEDPDCPTHGQEAQRVEKHRDEISCNKCWR